MTAATLTAFAAGRGFAAGVAAILGAGREAVSGSRIGGGTNLGAMTDGDENTYFIIEAGYVPDYYAPGDPAYIMTPVWGDFVLPAGSDTPTSLTVRARLVTPEFSQGNDPGGARDWRTFVTDTSWTHLATIDGAATPLTTIENVSQAVFADFTYSIPVDAGTIAALTGGGLRVTVFMESANTVDSNFKWAYMGSLELLVETESAPPVVYVPPTRVSPSLRMLQRGGQGGMSGIPRMVGNPVRGLRQGPGSVY